MNQKINSILLSSHWRSKSCSTTPPSNICHSPAAGFFRPILSSLVNSSSLVPKTRPNRSTRKSVIRTRSVLRVTYSKNTVSSSRRQRPKCDGDRFSTLVFDLEIFDLHSRCADWKRKKFARLHASPMLSEANEAYEYCHPAKSFVFTDERM